MHFIFIASQVTICKFLVIVIFCDYLFVIYNVIEKNKNKTETEF